MDMDLILGHIGQAGLWQILIFVILSLVAASEALITLMYNFIGYLPEEYRCFVPFCDVDHHHYGHIANFTFALPPLDSCHMFHYIGPPPENISRSEFCAQDFFDQKIVDVCHEHVYDETNYRQSFIMEVDLAPCGDIPETWIIEHILSKASFVGMAYMAGLLIGSVIIGVMSDQLGRKRALLFAILWSSGTCFLGAFMDSYWAYVGLRFATGIGAKGLFMIPFMYAVEITGTDFRLYFGILIQGHVYENGGYGNSLIMELDLPPCSKLDPSWPLDPVISKAAFLGMSYMLGQFVGSFVVGIVGDKLGRVLCMVLFIIATGIFHLAGAFANSFWLYFALRLLSGAFSKGLFIPASTYSVEITGPEYRMILGILINIPYALGEIFVGLMAYFIQDWRTLQMTLAILVFLLSGLWFLMPESPRWLISKGRNEKARSILVKAAKMNGKTIPIKDLLILNGDNDGAPRAGRKLGVASLFARTYVTKITLIMFVNWIAATMAFYGLSLNSVNLGGDIYVNFILSAVIEIPSYIFVVLVMDGFGRKTILVFCQVLAGVTCIGAGFAAQDWLVTTLTLAGKFGASASFSIVYLYTAELYPTILRNSAVGTCSMMARIGSIVAPLLAGLTPLWIPLFVMGFTSLLGGLLAIFLPETLGMHLPETLDDMKALFDNSKHWYTWMSRSELAAKTAELWRTDRINSLCSFDDGADFGITDDKPIFIIPDIQFHPATPYVERKIPFEDAESQSSDDGGDPIPSPVYVSRATPTDSEAGQSVPDLADAILPVIAIETPVGVKSLRRVSSETSLDSRSSSLGNIPEEVEVQDADSIPTSPKETEIQTSPVSTIAPNPMPKSRKFSQLPPAAKDSSNATRIGNFVAIPLDIPEVPATPSSSSLAVSEEEKSRRLSQIAPAPIDSQHAVRVSSKFTMIPTEASHQPKDLGGTQG